MIELKVDGLDGFKFRDREVTKGAKSIAFFQEIFKKQINGQNSF